jgi:hypothetical protein
MVVGPLYKFKSEPTDTGVIEDPHGYSITFNNNGSIRLSKCLYSDVGILDSRGEQTIASVESSAEMEEITQALRHELNLA